jgi:hemolysin activation/secretion protein
MIAKHNQCLYGSIVSRYSTPLLGLLTIGLLNSFSVNPLQAQTPNIQPETIPDTEPERLDTTPDLPPPEELLEPEEETPLTPPDTETPSDSDIPTEATEKITVKSFEFSGNTAFTNEQLSEIVKGYLDRPISFAELLEARSAITQYYVDAGYVTSGAYIPPQELQEGVVKIEIVEGKLEDIQITGTSHLSPDYIRSRLELASDPPLNIPRLVEALQLLQLDPLIDKISAELSAGPVPGLSLLEVDITEADSFSLAATVDNGRSPSVGTFRQKIELREGNVFGIGDAFNFGYTNTEGSDVFEVGYNIPFNARNGTVRLGYSTSSSGVIEPPFDDLDGDGSSPDIESESRSYEISVRQPIVLTPTTEFAIGLTGSRQESETSLLEIPFPLSPGADDLGRTRISSLRFFQEWTQRSENEVIAMRSQFSFGLDLLDATVNETDPDGEYFAWRGQAQWVKLLAPETLFLIRTDLQLADRALLPLEQFGLGGTESVRGYRQDVLLTDNGWLASMEVRIPLFNEPEDEIVLQLVPFFDFGVGWNNGDRPDPVEDTLASLGLGLLFRYGDDLNARVDWGIPLIDVDSRDRTLQEEGFTFSVTYKLF